MSDFRLPLMERMRAMHVGERMVWLGRGCA
jgi:hypothetical protein